MFMHTNVNLHYTSYIIPFGGSNRLRELSMPSRAVSLILVAIFKHYISNSQHMKIY